jgi:hypothetical protein
MPDAARRGNPEIKSSIKALNLKGFYNHQDHDQNRHDRRNLVDDPEKALGFGVPPGFEIPPPAGKHAVDTAQEDHQK